jgi:hypothetical protein
MGSRLANRDSFLRAHRESPARLADAAAFESAM